MVCKDKKVVFRINSYISMIELIDIENEDKYGFLLLRDKWFKIDFVLLRSYNF